MPSLAMNSSEVPTKSKRGGGKHGKHRGKSRKSKRY